MIREGRIHHFFFYRHAAGGLVDKSHALHVMFKTTASIRQGFTLQEHSCQYCESKSAGTDKRCKHLAALTILSLSTRNGDERNIFPMPLHFEKTGWFTIGDYLYSWLSCQVGKTRTNLKSTTFQLTRIQDVEGINVTLPCVMEVQWRIFFTDMPENNEEKTLQSLYERIIHLTRTINEIQLLRRNTETRGSKRDASLWSWLCRYLALHNKDILPNVYFDSNNKHITLQHRQNTTELTITLPKHQTWKLISSLCKHNLDITILPPAQECSQVKFLSSGSILVVPGLRMDDDSFTAISELDEQKMGSCYFLPERGFLPITKQTGKGLIKHPDDSGQLDLFNFAKRIQTQTQTFSIDTNLIPQFLQQNAIALKHPDNFVDKNILEIKTVSLPQELVINSFDEDRDWCYISFHYGMGDTTIELEDILAATTAKADFIPGKEWLELSESPLSWLYDILPERLLQSKNGRNNILRLRPGELMALTSIVPDIRNNVSKKDFRDQLASLLDSDSWTDDSLLHDCPNHLRDYQRHGLAWLSSLYRFGLGGLLADDMGLGKTHQGLALLDMIARQSKHGRFAGLIICPASVLYHWKNKIDSFYPQLEYNIHYGPGRVLDTSLNPGLLITTYATARIDQELLSEIPFDIILLDEIQNLKNRKIALYKAVTLLKTRVTIGLTGTPIENSLNDLYSLFSLCLPGFFGTPKNFSNIFFIPIQEHKSRKTTKTLRRLIHPFILRRNRKQVLTELPDLTIDDRICELSDTQVKLYRDAVDESVEMLDELESEDSKIKYINLLAMLTRLKQICNHPCLLEGCIDAEQYESGKWDIFIELLSDCLDANLKVVVFSQYTGMLDIIENYLEKTGIGYASLRGNMPITVREKMLTTFSNQKSCKIFCASLLAGGTGIDLVAAQVVIHYDRWWNPAKEVQATARVHRMGQKQQVQVFRLITTGTLEEKIHALLKRKQKMADSLISEDESGIIKTLDRSQLKELFRLG